MKSILLALSSFRFSKDAIDLAIRLSEKHNHLIICYFTDENIYRYVEDVPFDMREGALQELREHFVMLNALQAKKVEEEAKRRGIENIEIISDIGRFADLVLDIDKKINAEYIITTRSSRSRLMRRIFGSPIDRIKNEASCKVLEV